MKKNNILPMVLIGALPILLAMGEPGIKFIFWGLVFRSLFKEYWNLYFPNNRETVRQ